MLRDLLIVHYPGRPPQSFVQTPKELPLPPHAPSTHPVCSGVWAWSSQDAMKLCPFPVGGGGACLLGQRPCTGGHVHCPTLA